MKTIHVSEVQRHLRETGAGMWSARPVDDQDGDLDHAYCWEAIAEGRDYEGAGVVVQHPDIGERRVVFGANT